MNIEQNPKQAWQIPPLWSAHDAQTYTHPNPKKLKKVQEGGGAEVEQGEGSGQVHAGEQVQNHGLDHEAVGKTMGHGAMVGLDREAMVELGCGAVAGLGHGTVADRGSMEQETTRSAVQTGAEIPTVEQMTTTSNYLWDYWAWESRGCGAWEHRCLGVASSSHRHQWWVRHTGYQLWTPWNWTYGSGRGRHGVMRFWHDSYGVKRLWCGMARLWHGDRGYPGQVIRRGRLDMSRLGNGDHDGTRLRRGSHLGWGIRHGSPLAMRLKHGGHLGQGIRHGGHLGRGLRRGGHLGRGIRCGRNLGWGIDLTGTMWAGPGVAGMTLAGMTWAGSGLAGMTWAGFGLAGMTLADSGVVGMMWTTPDMTVGTWKCSGAEGTAQLWGSSSATLTVNIEPASKRAWSIYFSRDQCIFPPGSRKWMGSLRPTRNRSLRATSLKSPWLQSSQNFSTYASMAWLPCQRRRRDTAGFMVRVEYSVTRL